MLTLKDYVNWGLTHCDKTASAEGVPLILEKCVKNKKMKQLEVYGNSVQNGTPSPDNPVEVESVGELTGIMLDKDLYGDLSLYSVAESYTAYKRMYIEGLKPDTPYYVTVNRLNGSQVNTVKTIMVISGGTFSVAGGYYSTLSHTNGSADYNFSPHTTDSEGRLTIGIVNSATQEQLETILSNVDVYFAETKEEADNSGKYKIPVTVRGKNIFNCKNSKSLYNGYVSAGSIRTTDSDVSWTSQDGGTSAVHMDLGLLSQYVGKQLTLSFEVDMANGESVNSTRFVMCTEKGQERVEVNGKILNLNGRYYVTSTIPNRNENDHLTLRLYISYINPYTTYTFKNVMVSIMPGDVEFELYVEPIKTNIYLNEPLDYADVLNFRDEKVKRSDGTYEDVECELPSLPAKTTVIEIDTSVTPSNIKGKYIKK
jgi:hypothetical protein